MGFDLSLLKNSNEPFIIAETAFSHEGSSNYLRKLVSNLKSVENIGVKFQILIDKDEFLTPTNKTYNVIDKWILPEKEWEDIIDETYFHGLPIIPVALDFKALNLINKKQDKISAIEIHPSCIPDIAFMKEVVEFCKKTSLPLIIGVSGFTFIEIDYLLNNQLEELDNDNILLMYGFQNYPTNFEALNLQRIELLKELFDVEVGYADHTEYNSEFKEYLITSVYGQGSNIIEIHYVLDYGKERIDFITAYDSKRLVSLLQKLSVLNNAKGKKQKEMDSLEKDYSNKFRKAPVYSKDLKKGQVLLETDLNFKRCDKQSEFSLQESELIIGRRLLKDVNENQMIIKSDLE